MKIKNLIVISLLITYLTDSNARKIENTQFALIGYEVTISNEFREEIADLNSIIFDIRGYSNKKQDKLEGKIYDISYPYIEEKLEKRYSIDILPVNSFVDAVKYNAYGYPEVPVKKAQQLGNSRYYLKIIISIETTTPSDKDAKNSVLYKGKTNPIVTVTAEVYERVGVLPIGKASGIAKVSQPQRVEKNLLKGITRPISEDEVHELDETLFALILKAIENMVINFDKNI